VSCKSEGKPPQHERIHVCKGPPDKTVAPYDRAARYRPLLQSVAERILGDRERAEVAVEHCLYSACTSSSALDCEGAFRSWLVRLAMDGAFSILHGTSVERF
jgi:DNA-directed RNA polymerase specialized sigma24 family protein